MKSVLAVVITKITPLCLILTLDSIETNGEQSFVARYVISMERQAAALPAQRGKRQHYASVGEKVGEKNDAFTIKEVNGSPGNPGDVEIDFATDGHRRKGDAVQRQAFSPHRRLLGGLEI